MKKINLLVLATAFVASTAMAQVGHIETTYITSATKSKQSIEDVTSDVEVITSEEIEERRYTTIVEALNSVSGINVTSSGGLGQPSAVRINGMHYSTTLVLIDGVRYNDITNGSAFLENILLSDIEQIEIIKGAQSGIWGADASGGVINIITKTVNNGVNVSAFGEVGAYGTKKYGGFVSYKESSYYLKLNVEKVSSDGFSSQVPNGEDVDSFEDDGYKNTTTSIKAGYKINETNKVDILHTSIDSEVEYDSYNSPNDSQTNSNSKSKFTKINFNHIDSFSEINIYASKSSFDRKDPQGYTTEFIGEVKEIGLNSIIKYDKKDFLLLGIDKKEFFQEKGYVIDYKNDGVFLTNSNTINQTTFTQSLRYDSYTSFKNKFTGKVGAKHFVNDFTFSINYGTGYKAPSLYELSHDGGNDLNPEYTKSFDISAKYKDIEVKYFKNKIDDLMSYNNNNTDIIDDDYYENGLGTSIIKGYEVNYKKPLGEFLFDINYTKLNAKDKDGLELGRVPEENIKLSVDYYGIEKVRINVNGEYIGQRFDRNGGANADEQSETGNYTVFNSVVNYELNDSLKAYAKLDNITDKYYQSVNGYATAGRSVYVGMQASY